MIPKFSIVTSFYNEPTYLIEKCYESVVNQTFEDFEWIITDDWSQDERTTNLVKSLPERDNRIKYVQEKEKKEIWWNPHTYAEGKIVTTLDGDDFLFPKTLEVLNYFYDKYQDVICITTELHNYRENENGGYGGSIYLNYENYRSHFNYCKDIRQDESIPKNEINTLFTHGYNRSYRNIGKQLDFREDLDKRLIIVDFLELTKMEEIGKILHIPRCLYGYNTRDASISRKIDNDNDFSMRTQEIDQRVAERRKGKENVDTIKRLFDGVFTQCVAFFGSRLNTEIDKKNISLITPKILTLFQEQQLRELYFDHNLFFNVYDDENIDYYFVQFTSMDEISEFIPIYNKLLKYCGKKRIIFQITYKEFAEDNVLYQSFLNVLQGRHNLQWYDFNNVYQIIEIL